MFLFIKNYKNIFYSLFIIIYIEWIVKLSISKIGNIYKAREYKDEAIDCYQTIMENFPDTVFYPKAKRNLENLGVEVMEFEPTVSVDQNSNTETKK